MKIFLFLIIFLISIPSFSKVKRFTGFEEGNKGVSLLLGQPTLVRYNYWSMWKRKWNFGMGWDFEGFLTGEVNYTFYTYDAKDIWRKKNVRNVFLFNYGPGVYLLSRVSDEGGGKPFRGGLRLFTGLDYLFGTSGWALSGEIGTNMAVVGDQFLGFRAMVGVTYYFDAFKIKREEMKEDEEFDEPEIVEPVKKKKKRKRRKARKKPSKDPNSWEGEEWNDKEALPDANDEFGEFD